jgi:hypothetical protein
MLEEAFAEESLSNEERLNQIRARLEDQDYLSEAIQRIALVLSNELSPQEGNR